MLPFVLYSIDRRLKTALCHFKQCPNSFGQHGRALYSFGMNTEFENLRAMLASHPFWMVFNVGMTYSSQSIMMILWWYYFSPSRVWAVSLCLQQVEDELSSPVVLFKFCQDMSAGKGNSVKIIWTYLKSQTCMSMKRLTDSDQAWIFE